MKTKTEIKLWFVAVVLIIANAIYLTYNVRESRVSYIEPQNYFTLPISQNKSFEAIVTAYNTVSSQTDLSPCVASGGNICGRDDVVACPRHIPLYSWVKINGKEYQCMDRLAIKYNNRFDISFDKDIDSARKFGKQKLVVEMIK